MRSGASSRGLERNGASLCVTPTGKWRRGVLLALGGMLCGGAVSGCETVPVRLQHPTTGHLVQCGPYRRLLIGIPAMILENNCVNDFQKAGYERLP